MNTGSDYNRIPESEQLFPGDRILYTPEFPDSFFEVSKGHDSGFIFCHFLVEEGAELIAGVPFAEFETSKVVVEHAAPCDAIVEKLLVTTGDAVGSNQPLVKIRRK